MLFAKDKVIIIWQVQQACWVSQARQSVSKQRGAIIDARVSSQLKI
jgi:hypothetical protein